MDRISQLCKYLDPCTTFADVACDHGYCAEYMLKNRLCESAVISDISAKSLSKAEKLLSRFIENGKCRPVVCDGLEKIECSIEQVLIAGIGGEEIVKILRNSFIPQSFVFQPMKNAETLRAYLLHNGCTLIKDDIFTDGRNYYFIIKGRRGSANQIYTKAQLAYGRDSLNNPVLKEYLQAELEKKRNYFTREMTETSRAELLKNIKFIEGVLNGETD